MIRRFPARTGKRRRCVMVTMTTQSLIVGPALLAALATPTLQVRSQPTVAAECNRPIAHFLHDGLSLSVSIDSRDNRSIEVVAPQKDVPTPSTAQVVHVKVRLRDERVLEGAAERQPSVSSGGWVDWRYRFDTRQPLTMASIFSVTVSIANQTFEVFPW